MNNNHNNSSSRSCNQSTERQVKTFAEGDFEETTEEEAETHDLKLLTQLPSFS